jgi:hypothetical protein
MGSLAAFTNLQTLDISHNQFSDPAILSKKLPESLLVLFGSYNNFPAVPSMINILCSHSSSLAVHV